VARARPGEVRWDLLAWESMHRSDWNWLRAIESPTKTRDLPLRDSKVVLASIWGSSHVLGFHRQYKNSLSIRPFVMQFWWPVMYLHVSFVYARAAPKSCTHVPLDRSQTVLLAAPAAPAVPEIKQTQCMTSRSWALRWIQLSLQLAEVHDAIEGSVAVPAAASRFDAGISECFIAATAGRFVVELVAAVVSLLLRLLLHLSDLSASGTWSCCFDPSSCTTLLLRSTSLHSTSSPSSSWTTSFWFAAILPSSTAARSFKFSTSWAAAVLMFLASSSCSFTSITGLLLFISWSHIGCSLLVWFCDLSWVELLCSSCEVLSSSTVLDSSMALLFLFWSESTGSCCWELEASDSAVLDVVVVFLDFEVMRTFCASRWIHHSRNDTMSVRCRARTDLQ